MTVIAEVRDVELNRQAHDLRFEPSKNEIPATIVAVDGDVTPPNEPELTWVLEYGRPNSPTKVLNDTTLREEGLPVLIGPDPRPPFRKIIGPYTGSVPVGQGGDVILFNIPPHAQNHQMPTEATIGNDPVKIYQPAIQPMKLTGDGVSMTVTVQALTYTYNGVPRDFYGQLVDLTSYVPISGQFRLLVYLDPETGSLGFLEGNSVPYGGIPVPSYPAIPAGTRGIAWVLVYEGQTVVTTATDVRDARDPWPNTNPSSLSATAVGQILISLDGSTFEPHLPLTSEDGWLVNEDGELLVVG